MVQTRDDEDQPWACETPPAAPWTVAQVQALSDTELTRALYAADHKPFYAKSSVVLSPNEQQDWEAAVFAHWRPTERIQDAWPFIQQCHLTLTPSDGTGDLWDVWPAGQRATLARWWVPFAHLPRIVSELRLLVQAPAPAQRGAQEGDNY